MDIVEWGFRGWAAIFERHFIQAIEPFLQALRPIRR